MFLLIISVQLLCIWHHTLLYISSMTNPATVFCFSSTTLSFGHSVSKNRSQVGQSPQPLYHLPFSQGNSLHLPDLLEDVCTAINSPVVAIILAAFTRKFLQHSVWHFFVFCLAKAKLLSNEPSLQYLFIIITIFIT